MSKCPRCGKETNSYIPLCQVCKLQLFNECLDIEKHDLSSAELTELTQISHRIAEKCLLALRVNLAKEKSNESAS